MQEKLEMLIALERLGNVIFFVSMYIFSVICNKQSSVKTYFLYYQVSNLVSLKFAIQIS